MIFLTGVVLAIFVVPDPWRVPVVIGFAILEIVETTVTWRLSRRWARRLFGALIAQRIAVTYCRRLILRVRAMSGRRECEDGARCCERVRFTPGWFTLLASCRLTGAVASALSVPASPPSWAHARPGPAPAVCGMVLRAIMVPPDLIGP